VADYEVGIGEVIQAGINRMIGLGPLVVGFMIGAR
jgi:hypothetical protein